MANPMLAPPKMDMVAKRHLGMIFDDNSSMDIIYHIKNGLINLSFHKKEYF